MCLAIPGMVKCFLDDDKTLAVVDFVGIEKEISTELLKNTVSVGDYVIVHVGFAIQKIDVEEALESLKEWKNLQNFQEEMGLTEN